MLLNLEVDATEQSLTSILSLVYSFADAGSKFTADDAKKALTTQLDGSKLLTAQQYNTVSSMPYKLSFAVPPVPPS